MITVNLIYEDLSIIEDINLWQNSSFTPRQKGNKMRSVFSCSFGCVSVEKLSYIRSGRCSTSRDSLCPFPALLCHRFIISYWLTGEQWHNASTCQAARVRQTLQKTFLFLNTRHKHYNLVTGSETCTEIIPVSHFPRSVYLKNVRLVIFSEYSVYTTQEMSVV